MPSVSKRQRLSEDTSKTESLNFHEVKEILKSCDSIKKRALIELAVSTAIRRDDIVNIEIDNIDLENSKLQFWEKKKKRTWEVPLEPELMATLIMYMKTLPKGAKYLFPAEQSNANHLSDKTAYNWLQEAMKKAGLTKKMDFHGLRRTYVRLAKRMGYDMKWVQEMTGDTAEVILKHYDGWKTDEMSEILKDGGIIKKVQE